jgi:L-alanine-DL-glutamate epimerase-like enolase superfamily enzyme
MLRRVFPAAPIERIEVAAFAIPTEQPESDGTFAWDKTILVVEISAGNNTGLGYTYADSSTARFIHDNLTALIRGRDAYDIPEIWSTLQHSVRNLGRPGVASMAISAVDVALWDLKAKLLSLPLYGLLGATRSEVPLYASGGFTSYSTDQLVDQFSAWAEQGFTRVKMKVGREPSNDRDRVQAARNAIGNRVELFVDANGAYSRKQALAFAEFFAEFAVTWFEEPVSSDDPEGLKLIRDQSPAGMAISAGEYGYDAVYFRRMLESGAVDVLQVDATRCGGITGMMKAAAVCESFCLPLSTHCAPALHLHPSCALSANLHHLEYFHDHARIESMLFDGNPTPNNGMLRPDQSYSGIGLEFKRVDAQRYAI